MRSDPFVRIECDRCGIYEYYDMTPLAQRSWDLRNLDRQLENDGWRISGDEHICHECQEDMDRE